MKTMWTIPLVAVLVMLMAVGCSQVSSYGPWTMGHLEAIAGALESSSIDFRAAAVRELYKTIPEGHGKPFAGPINDRVKMGLKSFIEDDRSPAAERGWAMITIRVLYDDQVFNELWGLASTRPQFVRLNEGNNNETTLVKMVPNVTPRQWVLEKARAQTFVREMYRKVDELKKTGKVDRHLTGPVVSHLLSVEEGISSGDMTKDYNDAVGFIKTYQKRAEEALSAATSKASKN